MQSDAYVKQDQRNIHPLALAMEWVTKITTVALEMVLPTIGGSYLDRWYGTKYWALAGLVVGFSVGMWHLLQMTRVKSNRNGGGTTSDGSDT